MKNKYLFGFTCKPLTQKEIKSILTGKNVILNKIAILRPLPKTEEVVSNIGFYDFSPEFSKIIQSICITTKKKGSVFIENLSIESVSYTKEIKIPKESSTIQGSVTITYTEILSGLGGSWEIPKSENFSYIFSFSFKKQEAYLFLSMKK